MIIYQELMINITDEKVKKWGLRPRYVCYGRNGSRHIKIFDSSGRMVYGQNGNWTSLSHAFWDPEKVTADQLGGDRYILVASIVKNLKIKDDVLFYYRGNPDHPLVKSYHDLVYFESGKISWIKSPRFPDFRKHISIKHAKTLGFLTLNAINKVISNLPEYHWRFPAIVEFDLRIFYVNAIQ